jgi:arylsulfatase A-like enzyme
LPSTVSGAAAGAVALAAVAAVDLALRPGSLPPAASPLRDLSLLAAAGSVAGAALGLVRSAGAGFLSPAGITLGAALALGHWLAGVSGSRVLTGGAAPVAVQGAALLLAGAVAGQLLGLLLRRLPAPPASAVRDLVVVAALAAPAAWPAGRGGPGPGGNVVLLTVDTLRADRLGCAGSPLPLTPHLDRLARRGTAFSRAVTPLPRTLPATASLHTGMDPPSHGVRDNFHYALAPAAATLAEELSARGFACGAVNSNPALSHDSGIFQGFASANDRGDDWSRLGLVRGVGRVLTLLEMRRGDRDAVVTDLALRWLRRRPADRPFFLWVHWLAPHMPYEPAYPFDRTIDPGYDGAYRHAIGYETVSKGDMTYRNPLTERERAHAVALYDGEVATSDRAVGRLLRAMERGGLLRDTRVIFTADHGESLLEHGYFFNHGDFVYGPAANVPLIVAGGVPAGAIDLSPLSLSGVRARLVPADPAGSVQPVAGADAPLFGESGFCRFPDLNDRLGFQLPADVAQSPDAVPDWRERWEEQANRAKQRFVQQGRWKLVRSPREDGDVHELFDLEADPGETVSVAAAHPDTAAALSALLDEWIARSAAASSLATDRVLDEDTREGLDALGYLGS